jgi:nucleoid DNA-binding protein
MNESNTKATRTTVGRADLEREIHERYGIPRKHVETTVRAFLSGIASTLRDGGRVEMRGTFGVFDTRISRRKAKVNPLRPGQVVPARVEAKVTFKPGKALYELVQSVIDDERGAA